MGNHGFLQSVRPCKMLQPYFFSKMADSDEHWARGNIAQRRLQGELWTADCNMAEAEGTSAFNTICATIASESLNRGTDGDINIKQW